jgi:hypothetical protein
MTTTAASCRMRFHCDVVLCIACHLTQSCKCQLKRCSSHNQCFAAMPDAVAWIGREQHVIAWRGLRGFVGFLHEMHGQCCCLR